MRTPPLLHLAGDRPGLLPGAVRASGWGLSVLYETNDKELIMKNKDWSNVYVLRQEYNKYQRRWFPIIV